MLLTSRYFRYKHAWRFFLLLGGLVSSAIAAPESRIWRCQDVEKQQIIYSDQPCNPNAPQNGAISITPNILNTHEAREKALRAELSRLRHEVQNLKSQLNQPDHTPAAAASTQPYFDSLACNEARRDYKKAAFASNNRAALQAQRNIMNAACALPQAPLQQQNIRNEIRINQPSPYHYALPAAPLPPRPIETTPPAPPPAFAPTPGCRILPNGGFRCPTLIH